MVRFDILKPNGWKTVTLTEDIEFSLQRIIKGKRLGWATDAIVYDEQPVGFKQSWSQRSRWTVGHMQCIQEYTKKLAVAVKENKSLVNIDGFLNILRYIVPTFILPIFTGMFVMWLDKRPIKPMLKGLLCYPLFMGSWLLINFKCLFKRDLTWEKINHVRNIKIGEVSQTEQVETEKELI